METDQAEPLGGVRIDLLPNILGKLENFLHVLLQRLLLWAWSVGSLRLGTFSRGEIAKRLTRIFLEDKTTISQFFCA